MDDDGSVVARCGLACRSQWSSLQERTRFRETAPEGDQVTGLQQLPPAWTPYQCRFRTCARFSANETSLREAILAGDERILAQGRVLHEDVISRLALIQEGR